MVRLAVLTFKACRISLEHFLIKVPKDVNFLLVKQPKQSVSQEEPYETTFDQDVWLRILMALSMLQHCSEQAS